LISTSSVWDILVVESFKKNFSKYFNAPSGDKDPLGYHHEVYRQFMEVNTLDDLKVFNEYFRDFILICIFRLSEMMIRRMKYSIPVLQHEMAFAQPCREAQVQLEKLIEVVERGKRDVMTKDVKTKDVKTKDVKTKDVKTKDVKTKDEVNG
jgi:hypothetical protein